MFRLSNNGIISVNRGDSFELPITLIASDSALEPVYYAMKDTDILYVGIMEPNQPFECALIRKKVTAENQEGSCHIAVRFWPEDTINVLPGKYYYQVKLETIDPVTLRHDVETVVDKTLFYIRE